MNKLTSFASFDIIVKHTYGEPRFLAELEWSREHGLWSQIFSQVPREELEEYVATGQHPNPDRTITLAVHEEPDWEWWEPTSRWRRLAARGRELDQLLAG